MNIPYYVRVLHYDLQNFVACKEHEWSPEYRLKFYQIIGGKGGMIEWMNLTIDEAANAPVDVINLEIDQRELYAQQVNHFFEKRWRMFVGRVTQAILTGE